MLSDYQVETYLNMLQFSDELTHGSNKSWEHEESREISQAIAGSWTTSSAVLMAAGTAWSA